MLECLNAIEQDALSDGRWNRVSARMAIGISVAEAV